ncbi:hypothetical protein MHYP_G00265120 [Metynnis hypsauchen]
MHDFLGGSSHFEPKSPNTWTLFRPKVVRFLLDSFRAAGQSSRSENPASRPGLEDHLTKPRPPESRELTRSSAPRGAKLALAELWTTASRSETRHRDPLPRTTRQSGPADGPGGSAAQNTTAKVGNPPVSPAAGCSSSWDSGFSQLDEVSPPVSRSDLLNEPRGTELRARTDPDPDCFPLDTPS